MIGSRVKAGIDGMPKTGGGASVMLLDLGVYASILPQPFSHLAAVALLQCI